MKRISLLLTAILFTLTVNSQQESIMKGDVLINPSITLGTFDYGLSYSVVNILPPVGINFEYAAHNLLSIGGEFEYAQRNYRNELFNADYSFKYQYKVYNLRASFHYFEIIKNLLGDNIRDLNSSKIDLYIGASTGVFTTSITERISNSGGTPSESKSFSSNYRFGMFAGFRYYFTERFGTFLEAGRNSLGWTKFGLTLKI